MHDTAEKVFLGDRLVDADEARVSAGDAGLLHGVGLFETLRAYEGRVFRLEAHLDRLARSIDALRLPFALDRPLCRKALADVLAANAMRNARLRLTVTAGRTDRGGEDDGAVRPTVLATAAAVAAYPPEYYRTGMTVLISRFRQSRADPLAGHKTTCYWPRLIALREAHAGGCGEALWFTDQNLLAEGCVSNVFIVKGDVLKTPPLDTPVLPGIARGVILGAASASGQSVLELPLTVNDLLDADEVFLTNSIMEVMPVCRVERKAIGNEKPGPITRWATGQYAAAVEADA